jgi:hydroxyacid-oxoacid transhydrogenase
MGKERSSELDRVRDEDLGMVLREEICKFLDLVGVPRGLAMVGYKSEDVSRVCLPLSNEFYTDEKLVEGMLPQKRVLDLAPILAKDNLEQEREQLTGIIEASMNW